MRVRDESQANPRHFALTTQGIAAAQVLYEYQRDTEQLKNSCTIPQGDYPVLETGVPIWDHPVYLHEHLHSCRGENDPKIARVMERLADLDYEFKNECIVYNLEHCRSEMAFPSCIQDVYENSIILDMLHQIPAQANMSADEFGEEGMLDYEDKYGANPEYMAAKLHWWAAHMSIQGLEAIVRYHFERIHRLRCSLGDIGFLTEEQEVELNMESPEHNDDPQVEDGVPEGDKVFERLKAAQIVRNHDDRQPVLDWLSKEFYYTTAPLPNNLFVEDDEFPWEATKAADALVEYQDEQ